MEIKYKNKPSEELINKYCKKLEEFLSAHNLSIHIELWDTPLRIESYVNGRLTEVKNIWIKEVVVKNPKIDELQVRLMRQGIDENIGEKQIWRDAYYIQDQIYKHLNLTPKLPSDPYWKNDSYWKLWDYLKNQK